MQSRQFEALLSKIITQKISRRKVIEKREIEKGFGLTK